MEWTYLAFGSREQLKLSQFPLISKKETSVNVVGAFREREREREREIEWMMPFPGLVPANS